MNRSAAHKVTADNLRDLRIMARQRKGFDYIRAIFGWSPDTMREICAREGISITDAPITPPPRNLSARSNRGSMPDGKRLSLLKFSTHASISDALLIEARERGMSISAIVDRIVSNAHAAGLWPALINHSCPVASASHQNQNNE